MITLRKASERGHANHGWLDTWHSFSFADYYDPQHIGFRSLHVINEDRITPGAGFGMHPHRNMEIVTVVLEGELEHRDSLGNGAVLRPGEVQRMTAGRGIRHSEFNPSPSQPVHLLQIWITPERPSLEPGYEQRSFASDSGGTPLRLVVARDGRLGALKINQDVDLHLGRLEAGTGLTQSLAAGRHAWVQVTAGNIMLNGLSLRAGDGAAISDETTLCLQANETSQFLLFDLS